MNSVPIVCAQCGTLVAWLHQESLWLGDPEYLGQIQCRDCFIKNQGKKP